MLTALEDAQVHATPNATMRRYPGTDVAVWRTEMAAGARGPRHRMDVDQVVVVLDGVLEVHLEAEPHRVAVGGSVLLPAGRERQLVAADAAVVLLCASLPGGVARVGEGEPVEVPWAQ